MMTQILYVFLVHVIACTTAESRERRLPNNAGNQTRTSLSNSNQNTYQNSTNKECLVTVNETDLYFLQQLARSKVVHVVELDLQFVSNTSNSMIKQWRWNLTNNVGQEILAVLAMRRMFVTWTLDVGRTAAKVEVFDEPPGCVTSEKEARDFIAGAILKQLSFAHEKEMCFDKVSSKSTTRCCKIIGIKGLLKYQCYVSVARSEFVNILESMLSVHYYFLIFGGVHVVSYFGIFLQSKNTNNTKHYKLTESPMSVSSILSMLFWDGHGRFKSFVRRCLLILVLFLFVLQINTSNGNVSIFVLPLSFWAMLYPFSSLFEEFSSDEHLRVNRFTRHLLKLFSYLGHDLHDVYLSARVDVLGGISLFTLPFNVKRWKKSLARFLDDFIAPGTLGSSLKGKILLYSKTGVFCLCYIVFIFIMQVIFVWLFAAESYSAVILKQAAVVSRKTFKRQCARIHIWATAFCQGFCLFYTIYFFLIILQFTPCIAIQLLSGLILNIVYFFPYVVSISILIFYSWMFWTSVEEQYVVLMRLIFDHNVNNSSSNNNSNNDNNDDNSNMNNGSSNANVGTLVNQENMGLLNMADTDYVGRDPGTRENNNVADIDDHTELVCVVSKELYDKVRERLLPYHGNLFRFVLNVFGISLFAYITLTLVRILQASDVSPTVQLLTTFSVSALPHILNTVAAKKSEERKGAWKEQLKHSVKPLVDKLTADNPELCRTLLIIQHQPLDLNSGEARVHESVV